MKVGELQMENARTQRNPAGAHWTRTVPERARPVYEFAKRAMDIVLSAIALIVLWPLMLGVAAAIRLDSRGKAIYKQARLGRGEKPFVMYKFRSMVQNADELQDTLRPLNECDGPVFKITDDPRLTRVGAFIRKTSIDELPQLLNILKGEMSIVGPRPPLPEEAAQYTDREKRRLTVKPGLTCYWQISGRSDLPFQRWIELDLQYIEQRGLARDIVIILKTIPVVFGCKGAY